MRSDNICRMGIPLIVNRIFVNRKSWFGIVLADFEVTLK